MSNEPSKAYSPAGVERRTYDLWIERGCFHATPEDVNAAAGGRPPFSIVIPPPNVTGALHLGHAINNTLQDILVRRKRMQGFAALWMPGVDHAGIATQAVVEKKLFEEEKKNRHDLGREALVERIWKWKEQYGNRIVEQLKLMGCSCDWQRQRFTLDETCARAVREWFFRMFRDGLIFRGKRLVNWDTHLQTAVADDEVYHETVKGHLWQIRYPLAGQPGVGGAGVPPAHRLEAGATTESVPFAGSKTVDGSKLEYLVVATTRPETMLADTAVAVHPDDERYRHLIGRHVVLPLTGRTIPIIADGILVKREFGTGCVKVTPGHDPNDYACYQRNPAIGIRNMMTPDGKVDAANAGEGGHYAGLKMDAARKKVVEDLEAAGLLHKVEEYQTDVGHSDRSKTPIQPYLSDQWFVRMGDIEADPSQGNEGGVRMGDGSRAPGLAQAAINALCHDDAHYEGVNAPTARKDCPKLHIFPRRYGKTYTDWLNEKRDWCISRQLWWGHRIPVWSATGPGDPNEGWGADGEALIEARGAKYKQWVLDGRMAWQGRDSSLGHVDQVDAENPRFALTWECVRAPSDSDVIRELESDGRIQDPDVLDTWFSSALWPLSTMGWPEQTLDVHPNRAATVRERCADVPAEEPLPHGRGSATHGRSSDKAGAAGTGMSPASSASPHTADSPPPEPGVLQAFFPTDVLSTAREIITLWVARMTIAALYNVGRVPFRDVVIHPVIQDGQGRPMKKSLGNGVDPVDIVDMYGADALRFTLAGMATETQDIRVPVKKTKLPDGREINTSDKFELGRNFCNKLWQAATGFILPNVADVRIEPHPETGGTPVPPGTRSPSGGATLTPALSLQGRRGGMRHTRAAARELPLFDRWIRTRLNACIRDVDAALDSYQFSRAADRVRDFFWTEFCDWYLEESKLRLNSGSPAAPGRPGGDDSNDVKVVLLQTLDLTLCLLHPFVPFVTEAIWEEIGKRVPRHFELIAPVEGVPAAPLLVQAPWPKVFEPFVDARCDAEVGGAIQPIIAALRQARTEINTVRSKSGQPAIRTLPNAVIKATPLVCEILRPNAALIQRLGGLDAVTIALDAAKPVRVRSHIGDGFELYVPLGDLIDIALEESRLRAELAEKRAALQRAEAQLANEGFVSRASPDAVQQTRDRAAELARQCTLIEQHMADLA